MLNVNFMSIFQRSQTDLDLKASFAIDWTWTCVLSVNFPDPVSSPVMWGKQLYFQGCYEA